MKKVLFSIGLVLVAAACASAQTTRVGGGSGTVVSGGGAYGTPGTTPLNAQICDSDSCVAVTSGAITSRLQDGAGTALTSTSLTGSKQALDVLIRQPDGSSISLATDPCGGTKSQAAISSNANGNFEIVALNGSEVIYVCSVDVTAEATVDFRFVTGTGTACATGETAVTGQYAFSTTTGLLGINKGNGGYYVYKTAAGGAFCGETSSGVQMNGSITYVRQ